MVLPFCKNYYPLKAKFSNFAKLSLQRKTLLTLMNYARQTRVSTPHSWLVGNPSFKHRSYHTELNNLEYRLKRELDKHEDRMSTLIDDMKTDLKGDVERVEDRLKDDFRDLQDDFREFRSELRELRTEHKLLKPELNILLLVPFFCIKWLLTTLRNTIATYNIIQVYLQRLQYFFWIANDSLLNESILGIELLYQAAYCHRLWTAQFVDSECCDVNDRCSCQ